MYMTMVRPEKTRSLNMRKYLKILLLTLTLCLTAFTGCGAATEVYNREVYDREIYGLNNLWTVRDGITLRLMQNSYLPGTETFTLVLENRSDYVMMYGDGWHFERYESGRWHKLETIENFGFTFLGYVLYDRDRRTRYLSTFMLKEPLKEGLHRVVGWGSLTVAKDYLDFGWDGDNVRYPPFVLEFFISENAPPEPELTPEREYWQWYTPWDAIAVFKDTPRRNSFSFGPGNNGLVAVLNYDNTVYNSFTARVNTITFYLDIFDRRTGEVYSLFPEAAVRVDFTDVRPVIVPYGAGVKIDALDPLYVFMNEDGKIEKVFL